MKRGWDLENKFPNALLKQYRYWTLEVSYRQHTLGCYIIFLNRQAERLSELRKEELGELRQIMEEIEVALEELDQFKPDRFNYLQLGNEMAWLHIHGIPRYKLERKFAGRVWRDENYGRRPEWSQKDVSEDLVVKIRDVIRLRL